MPSRPILFAGLLLICGSQRAAGQSAEAACFWPKPISECKSWIITESGLLVRLDKPAVGNDRVMLTLALGFMRNTSSRAAIGAEWFGATHVDDARGGIAVRARRWLAPDKALDVVAGAHLGGTAGGLDVGTGSPTLMTRYTYADKVAAVVRLDLLDLTCLRSRCEPQYSAQPDQNGMSARLYLGGELGEKPGLYSTLIAAASVVLLLIAYATGGVEWY